MAIRGKYLCPACKDDYPIIKFLRDADMDVFDAYSPRDWDEAYVDKQGEFRVLCIGGDTHDLTNFCTECARMISRARKNMEERLGHGKIKTRRAKDGKYVDLESHQEYMFMVDEAEPQWEFAMEGETTRNGEPLSFTDIDLAKLSMWRIRNVLNNKGFTDIPWHEIEEHAQTVSLTFLEKLKCGGCGTLCYMPGNEPCEVAAPETEIDSLHAYHWACCRGEAKRLMTEYVERRKAQLPQDIIDYAEKAGMSDSALIAQYNDGFFVQSIHKHNREAPMWKRLEVDGLVIDFEKAGITNVTPSDIKVLRNALLAHAGESKDGKNKDKVKRIIDKMGERAPEAYGILMQKVKEK